MFVLVLIFGFMQHITYHWHPMVQTKKLFSNVQIPLLHLECSVTIIEMVWCASSGTIRTFYVDWVPYSRRIYWTESSRNINIITTKTVFITVAHYRTQWLYHYTTTIVLYTSFQFVDEWLELYNVNPAKFVIRCIFCNSSFIKSSIYPKLCIQTKPSYQAFILLHSL